MDYELLMDSKWTQKSLAMYIKEVIERKLTIDYIEDSDYIVISCEYFTMSFDLEEIIGLDVIYEEYQFEANASARIQVFKKKFDEGLNLLFFLMKDIMDYQDNDILFLENGSIIVLEKRDNKLITHIDKNWETEYPFNILNRRIEIKRGLITYEVV